MVRHDVATFLHIQFDTDNKIFGLPRELVVTVAGKRAGDGFLSGSGAKVGHIL